MKALSCQTHIPFIWFVTSCLLEKEIVWNESSDLKLLAIAKNQLI